MNSPIKMEVGIEDCLHIEFEYNKSKYHLKDVIVGKIYFLLVRIKIKHMEIAIIKRETTGAGSNVFTENETIAKYEIMDGAPVKGESIPIRVFLAGYDLTPTMRDINKKFSVRYFLNLVLMDTEDRRYFKQQEITLWRKSEKTRKSLSNSAIGLDGSQSNLTQAQQNAQMPSYLVTQTSGHPGDAIAPLSQGSIATSHVSPTSSSITTMPEQSINNNIGLFTEEDSPQHEATSKVRSNPLAFDTDEDKTPSKEEEVPVSGKEPPQQQPSLEESSSLFDEPVITTTTTEQQNQSNIVSNNDNNSVSGGGDAPMEDDMTKDGSTDN